MPITTQPKRDRSDLETSKDKLMSEQNDAIYDLAGHAKVFTHINVKELAMSKYCNLFLNISLWECHYCDKGFIFRRISVRYFRCLEHFNRLYLAIQ